MKQVIPTVTAVIDTQTPEDSQTNAVARGW